MHSSGAWADRAASSFRRLAPLASDAYHAPASLQEIQAFIDQLNSGRVKVLFVHGTNPVFELPASLGFEEALTQVPQVISFATFPDETALQADYVFPDHHGLESWGYQQVATGANAPVLSGSSARGGADATTRSPRRTCSWPRRHSRGRAGGALAAALTFKDELAYIQSKLTTLLHGRERVLHGARDQYFHGLLPAVRRLVEHAG